MVADCHSLLQYYFHNPYQGYVYIYDKIVTLEDAKTRSFTEILKDGIAWKIFQTITTCVAVKDKDVLDVGAKSGYFSFLMAEAGANVCAVEKADLPSRVTACLLQLKNYRNLVVFHMSIEEFLDRIDSRFDLALMLNVFDHLLRQDEEMAWTVLRKISQRSKLLFLMMGPHKDVEIPYSFFDHSSYKQGDLILTHSYSDRNLWVFW